VQAIQALSLWEAASVSEIPNARTGVTESGRVYRLFGRPGRYSEAAYAYVWKKWPRINGHDAAECVDVSAEVKAAIAAAVTRAS